MRIIADAAIPELGQTFARHGEVVPMPGAEIRHAELVAADVLLVRTITRVDEALLNGTPVRFVGSATIGTDHLDTEWLEAAGIVWANAPASNADAAAQYTLGMMTLACRRLGMEIAEQTVGIIGRGNVGSRLARLLNALEIPWVANDPPLARQGESGLVSLEAVLERSIVSLHVPMTRTGPYPTWRMIGTEQLARIPDGGLLVNAARGDVIDGRGLLRELAGGRLHAALDTWPGEPEPEPALIAAATVATPHVAGYSREGKLRATNMIYSDFLKWLGQNRVLAGNWEGAKLPAPRAASVAELVERVTGVAGDDASLRATLDLDPGKRAAAFHRLRSDYVMRHEFVNFKVHDPALQATAGKLGFQG